MVITHTSV